MSKEANFHFQDGQDMIRLQRRLSWRDTYAKQQLSQKGACATYPMNLWFVILIYRLPVTFWKSSKETRSFHIEGHD